MTNNDFTHLNDHEFDVFLENIIETPSPSDMPQDINPWRKAMNHVLWGTGLTTLTLNFWKSFNRLYSSRHMVRLQKYSKQSNL